jgi:hypothetical protein
VLYCVCSLRHSARLLFTLSNACGVLQCWCITQVMEASQVPLISELFTLPADPNAGTGTFVEVVGVMLRAHAVTGN